VTRPESDPRGLKHKARHELTEYLINAGYLAFFFVAFTNYRRLLLAAHDIPYTDYWMPLIQALILGKVVTIGSLFRLGRNLEAKPLVYSALYKTFVFTILIGVFTVVEHGIKGLIKGHGFVGGLAELSARGSQELLGNGLVLLVALLPYFAVRELGRVLGDKTLRALFFQRRAGP